jgi:Integral peroxisomal membrane peroxin
VDTPVILTYRTPFAQLLRAALWWSTFVCHAAYHTWAELTRVPMPYTIPALVRAADATRSANTMVTAHLRFTFTVYENQRWWMGLDWTAALLPGECPSWCSGLQAPLSPLAVFALPLLPLLSYLWMASLMCVKSASHHNMGMGGTRVACNCTVRHRGACSCRRHR